MLCYCGRCRMYIKAQLEAEKDRANRLEQEERDKLLAFRLASGSNSNHTTVVVAAPTKEEKVRQEWQAGFQALILQERVLGRILGEEN